MDCKQLRARLDAGRLSERELDAVESHLTDCPGCGEYAETVSVGPAWLSLLRRDEPPQLSPQFWVRFWERQGRSVPDFWTVMTVLARRASIVLGIALVLLVFGLQFVAEPEQPTVAGLDEPTEYWATAAVQAADSEAGREQAVLTLVSRTE